MKNLKKFCDSLKNFHNSKRIKKPSVKFLRVWAKNQLRFENFEKIFKFTYKNLNGKPIFSPSFQDFCHFIHLWNIPHFVRLAWGGSFRRAWGWYFRVWGGRGLYKSLLTVWRNARHTEFVKFDFIFAPCF